VNTSVITDQATALGNKLTIDAVTVPLQLLIGGVWVKGGADRTISITNPSDASVIAEIADATAEDGLRAVTAASDALSAWSATPPRQRAEILRRCFELMTANSEPLARLISLENGKALPDARSEVAYAAEFFRWYSEEAVRITPGPGTRAGELR
jgi:succinate-semialdehyde dehydrogenase/glutarate-semialdehyde dehydrogenase